MEKHSVKYNAKNLRFVSLANSVIAIPYAEYKASRHESPIIGDYVPTMTNEMNRIFTAS